MPKRKIIIICPACGNSHEIAQTFTSNKAADKWLEEMDINPELCPDCYEQKRSDDRQKFYRPMNTKAAEMAVKRGLPALDGSEKQVAWATTIREEFCSLHPLNIKCKTPEEAKNARVVADYIRTELTQASYWIEHRHDLLNLMDEIKKSIEQSPPSTPEMKKAAEAEATVYPDNCVSDVISIIDIADSTIQISTKKDEKLIELFKLYGFKWNGEKYIWERKITPDDGAIEDRVAEIGNAILTAGYSVRIYDAEMRQKAIDGDYQREQLRRITARSKYWLSINWRGKNDQLYAAAMELKDAAYRGGSVVIPIQEADIVEEFAKLHDFAIDDNAKKAIAAYRAMKKQS